MKGSGRQITGKRFFAHFGLDVSTSRSFDAISFGDRLIGFQLKPVGGARTVTATTEERPNLESTRPSTRTRTEQLLPQLEKITVHAATTISKCPLGGCAPSILSSARTRTSARGREGSRAKSVALCALLRGACGASSLLSSGGPRQVGKNHLISDSRLYRWKAVGVLYGARALS